MGSPMIWSWCSRVKEKTRVSEDIFVLVERMAFDQVLGCKKIGLGSVDSEGASPPSVRASREAWSREPIW